MPLFKHSTIRTAGVFVAGALLMGLLVPAHLVAGSSVITPATAQVRATSCAGLDFHPADSDTWYGYVGTMIYHKVTSDPASQHGDGFFICNPNLPQSAVVTRVQFTVFDNFNGDLVRFCGLFRNPLAANAPGYQALAQTPSTGPDQIRTPGRVRLTDATINFPVINNAQYSYWLQCQVTAEEDTDQFTGIFGADVYYVIDPAKG